MAKQVSCKRPDNLGAFVFEKGRIGFISVIGEPRNPSLFILWKRKKNLV
jgi:hypothetical protein